MYAIEISSIQIGETQVLFMATNLIE